MSQKTNQEALAGLDKLIAETERRISLNPDYIALTALKKARAEIVGVTAKYTEAVIAEIMVKLDENPKAFDRKKVSQLAGAERALEDAGHPLSTRDLMEGAKKAGAVIGGNNPLVNFGSSLSKSDKFKSVRYKGEFAWWFADRQVPGGLTRRVHVMPDKEAAE